MWKIRPGSGHVWDLLGKGKEKQGETRKNQRNPRSEFLTLYFLYIFLLDNRAVWQCPVGQCLVAFPPHKLFLTKLFKHEIAPLSSKGINAFRACSHIWNVQCDDFKHNAQSVLINPTRRRGNYRVICEEKQLSQTSKLVERANCFVIIQRTMNFP